MVADDGVPTGQAVERVASWKARSREPAATAWGLSSAGSGRAPGGEVTEDLAAGPVEPEMTRSASETLPSKVTEQFGDKRGRRAGWPTVSPTLTTPEVMCPPDNGTSFSIATSCTRGPSVNLQWQTVKIRCHRTQVTTTPWS
ncbi:hypothetical protein GCM10010320_72000 [Streptomyces caelestis]|nr:hypothetical protein GCM10010320_72000 [Streptomyces caelestis]